MALSASAQPESLLDYAERPLGTCADGTPLMFHFLPAQGKLTDFKLSLDFPYILVADGGGDRLYSTETFKKIAHIDLGKRKLAQVTPQGYVTYSLDGLFNVALGRPSFFNFKGERVWKGKDMMAACDGHNGVIVCTRTQDTDVLVGNDLSTGKQLWQIRISGGGHLPWGSQYIDPSDCRMYYLMGEELLRLNVVTGDTLRHVFAASVPQPVEPTSAMITRGIPANQDFISEALHSYSVDGPVLTGTHSNILPEADRLYVADAYNVYCFDRSLRTVWQTALPEATGSKSAIRFDGGRLCLINYGLAFQKGTTVTYGRPFMAAYDKETGRQLSLAIPVMEENVKGGIYVGGRVYWQTDRGFLYTDEGENRTHELAWQPKTVHTPDDYYPDVVVHDSVWIVEQGMLRSVTTDRNHLVVEVYHRDINVIGGDGSCAFIPSDEAYFRTTGNVYVTNNGETAENDFVIIDPVSHKVKYSFRTDGQVLQDQRGHIYVATAQGVGIR